MKVIIHQRVHKSLARMPTYVSDVVTEVATLLENFPLIHADIKKLGPSQYRIRKGEYRIIFYYLKSEATILIYEVEIRGKISYSRG